MSINNLYLQKSGESGWIGNFNIGSSESPNVSASGEAFGIGTDFTAQPPVFTTWDTPIPPKLTVGHTGDITVLNIQHLKNRFDDNSSLSDLTYQAATVFSDATGGIASQFGLTEQDSYNLKLQNLSPTGDILFDLGSDLSPLTSSENFIFYTGIHDSDLDPTGKLYYDPNDSQEQYTGVGNLSFWSGYNHCPSCPIGEMNSKLVKRFFIDYFDSSSQNVSGWGGTISGVTPPEERLIKISQTSNPNIYAIYKLRYPTYKSIGAATSEDWYTDGANANIGGWDVAVRDPEGWPGIWPELYNATTNPNIENVNISYTFMKEGAIMDDNIVTWPASNYTGVSIEDYTSTHNGIALDNSGSSILFSSYPDIKGTGSFLISSGKDNLQVNPEYPSIETWIKMIADWPSGNAKNESGFSPIAAYVGSGSTGISSGTWVFGVDSSGYVTFDAYGGTGLYQTEPLVGTMSNKTPVISLTSYSGRGDFGGASTKRIGDNKWHHVAISHPGKDPVYNRPYFQISIDGEAADSMSYDESSVQHGWTWGGDSSSHQQFQVAEGEGDLFKIDSNSDYLVIGGLPSGVYGRGYIDCAKAMDDFHILKAPANSSYSGDFSLNTSPTSKVDDSVLLIQSNSGEGNVLFYDHAEPTGGYKHVIISSGTDNDDALGYSDYRPYHCVYKGDPFHHRSGGSQDGPTNFVSHKEFTGEISNALNEWKELFESVYTGLNLNFNNSGYETGISVSGDIRQGIYDLGYNWIGDIRFGMHGFGSSSKAIHSYSPGPSGLFGVSGTVGGDVHFNSGVGWRLDSTSPSSDPGAFSIKLAAVNAIGTSFGIGVDTDTESVMYGFSDSQSLNQLFPGGLKYSLREREAIENIYGPPTGGWGAHKINIEYINGNGIFSGGSEVTLEYVSEGRIGGTTSTKVIITHEGDLGVNITNPLARAHVVQDDEFDDIALFHKTGQKSVPEWSIDNQGKVGINRKSKRYSLEISGHKNTDGSQTDTYGTVFSQSYIYQTSGFDSSKPLGSNITINFDGPTFRNVDLTGDFLTTFTTSNGSSEDSEVKAVAIKLFASGATRYFDFDPNIKFLGVRPSGLGMGKVGVLSFNSFGEDSADTVAVYRSQDEESQQGPAGPIGPSLRGWPGEEFRDKIIGGDFSINPWQRMLPEQSGFYNVRSGEFTADRFVFMKSGNASGASDAPAGWEDIYGDLRVNIFKTEGFPSGEKGQVPAWSGHNHNVENQIPFPIQNSLLIDVTSGISGSGLWSEETHIGKFASIETRIEGYNAREILTDIFNLSFFVKSNQAGFGAVYLKNDKETVSYVQPYEICDANEWKHIVLNFLPVGLSRSSTYPLLPDIYDPYTGFNLEDGVGLKVGWTLGAHSGLAVPTRGIWNEGNYYTFSGYPNNTSQPLNIMSSGGTGESQGLNPHGTGERGYFSLAQVSLMKGNSMDPDLQLRSVGHEQSLCKRYFERIDFSSGQCVGVGQSRGNLPPTGTGINIRFEVEKVKIPTISGSGVFAANDINWNKGGIVGLSQSISSKDRTSFGFTGQGQEDLSFSNGNAVSLWASGDNGNYIFIDAEI